MLGFVRSLGRCAALLCALLTALGPAAVGANAALRRLDPAPFALRDTGTWATQQALIDELARRLPPTNMRGVLDSANRHVRPLGRPRALRGVRGVVAGFRWKRSDEHTRLWYPQGISGSSDAIDGSVWDGHRVGLVSWYSRKPGKANEGVRVSVVRWDRLSKATYRHVLLVQPVRRGGNVSFDPVISHAGGIAWYGRWLYAADTNYGLRVSGVERTLPVAGDGSTPIGCTSRSCTATGYRFVLPQIASY